MSTDMKIFEHPEFGTVRTITDQDNNPWFVAMDICEMLGLDTSNLSKTLDEDERGTCPVQYTDQVRNAAIINESGLYSLILRSRKPEAKRFKKWVTSEVLPSIRKTGQYAVQLSPAEFLVQQAHLLLEAERKSQKALEIATSASKRLDNIETAHDHFTVLGYCALNGVKISLDSAKRYGKKATKLCRSMNIEMGSVPDPRFGKANTYPLFVLRDIVQVESCA
jgi:prophage antirepressor-like protein